MNNSRNPVFTTLIFLSMFMTPIMGIFMDSKTLLVFMAALFGNMLTIAINNKKIKTDSKPIQYDRKAFFSFISWLFTTIFCLIFFYTNPLNGSASLIVVFGFHQLWIFVLSRAGDQESLFSWFMGTIVFYAGCLAVAMTYHENPLSSLMGVAYLVFNVCILLIVGEKESEVNSIEKQNENIKRFIPFLFIALIFGTPIFQAKQLLSQKSMLPSIGNLPGIGSSNQVVLQAEFQGEVPKESYWNYPDIYVMPHRGGEWFSFSGANSNFLEKIKKTTYYKRELVGETTYLYKSSPTYFMLNFTDSHKKQPDGTYQSVAFKQYRDRAISKNSMPPSQSSIYMSIPLNGWDGGDSIDLKGAQKNTPRTWAMVQAWKKEGLTDRQFVEKTLRYFQQNLAYNYDHQSMKPEDNELDWFLFQDRRGVCRHFANAFALIMRMGGVASRVRGGFYTNKFEDDGKTQIVRERDAHAWTEIWLDGEGWVLIDPTKVVPVEKGIPESSDAFFWDGVFSTKTFMSKFTTAGESGENASFDLFKNLKKLFTKKQKQDGTETHSTWKWLVAAVLIILAAALWCYCNRDRRDKKEIAWEKLIKVAHKIGIPIHPHEGPHTIGLRVSEHLSPDQKQAWMQTILDFEAWRYGGQDETTLTARLQAWKKVLASKNNSSRGHSNEQ